VNDEIAIQVRKSGVPGARMSRDDRLAVVARLDSLGVFERRRSVPAVAQALGTSRTTVYQLLADLRKDADAS
jgi:predicted transcriptional regulator YheO